MFYEPGVTEHGLPHDPFKVRKSLVVDLLIPADMDSRPAWFLVPLGGFPPRIKKGNTATGARKDTVVNAEETGTFVWNLATWDLREAVNISAEQTPYGTDEFELCNITKEQATIVDVPMVKESPVKFECEYHTTVRPPGNPPMGTVDIVIGKVIGVHIADEVLTDGLLDIKKTQPIARCGYYQYTVVRDTFEMIIPNMSADVLYGLEGNAARNRQKNEENEESSSNQ
ncbi:unnamed protein product [Aspergillus oryzae]|uniref:Unnamed protein product n=1 Tax=Aspergillus oryzae TaxID=5062 RepID=A0AAN4YVW8_ASPOZ|nr:unnamed protein product [Aspergillus oryzae]